MTEVVQFIAELKPLSGKGSARSARLQGKVPAIIYGNNQKEVMLSLSLKEIEKEYLKGGFRTRLVEIQLGGEKINALPREIQLHPVTDKPIHVDFLRVGKDTTVRVMVGIRVINEDKSPGVKKGGIVNLVHRSFEFECHPANIPNHLDIDIAGLDIGDNVHITDLKLPQGVKPVEKGNFTLISITGRTSEEDKASAAPAEGAATPAAAAAPAAKAAAKPAAKK
jgi:large subunit ribosomal protein L25